MGRKISACFRKLILQGTLAGNCDHSIAAVFKSLARRSIPVCRVCARCGVPSTNTHTPGIFSASRPPSSSGTVYDVLHGHPLIDEVDQHALTAREYAVNVCSRTVPVLTDRPAPIKMPRSTRSGRPPPDVDHGFGAKSTAKR